jgi:hypothetical protein
MGTSDGVSGHRATNLMEKSEKNGRDSEKNTNCEKS